MEKTIAMIGGTGAEGSALALHFAKAGFAIRIGSRDPQKAQATAQEISAKIGSRGVTGHTNPDAASAADIALLTVPLSAQTKILKDIHDHLKPGAILVDATVPLEIAIGGRLSRMLTLWDGSAAQQAARLAPNGVSVVAAFHSLSADALAHLDQPVDCDVLLASDSTEAKRSIAHLAEKISGVHAIDAGPLENARYIEHAAALLIALNLRHKVKHSGIRITGLPNAANSQ